MVKNKRAPSILLYVLILAIVVGVSLLFSDSIKRDTTKYSDVVNYFEQGQVKEFLVDGNKLTLKLRDDTTVNYRLAYVDMFYYDVEDYLGSVDVYDYKVQNTGILSYIVPMIVPVLLIVGMMIFMSRMNASNNNSAMSFGKSRTKTPPEKARKTFADVAGADEEKEELLEIVDFLKNPRKYEEMGARVPKGVLLYGPPGTGKTLLAKAVAGEANCSFHAISGSDFVEMYVGVGASRVRDLFDQAKRALPCIIFIDEIDAVGRRRGAGLGGGHDEREQTLNQLLVEMDGFGGNDGIVVMAATNRPDILDPALLRPGRFDRQITVYAPDLKGREEILKVHAKGKPFSPHVNFGEIAKGTIGMTGADLENILNESALVAARRNKKLIDMDDIKDAISKVLMGPEKKSRKQSDRERRLTAFHEAGHAVVSKFLPLVDPVEEISIIPRGMAGGYTLYLPQEDRSYRTKNEMEQRIASLLGGRAAEHIVLGDISTGASNDLERASETARNMVMRYGMSEKLGPVVFGSSHDEIFLGRDFGSTKNYSEEVATEIDKEVRSIIEQAFENAIRILTENRAVLDTLANLLLEKEKVSKEEFNALFLPPEEPLFTI